MSKTRPRSKIDTEYTKDLRYPDINDYLKDTYYAANRSNFYDNQSRTQLILRQQDNTLDLIPVTIAGFAREYFLNSFVFYGYNPELESVSHVRIVVDYLDGTDITYQKEFRRDEDEGILDGNRLQVVSTSFIDAGVSRVVNFGIFMDKRTIRNILEAVFNKHARKAFRHYFIDSLPDQEFDEEDIPKYNADRLKNFVDSRLYRLKIPIDIEVYYFDSEEPAATISAELSFGGVLQNLLGQIRSRSVSLQVNPLTDPAYRDSKFFKVGLNTTIPVELLLRSRINSENVRDYQLLFNKVNRARDGELSAFLWVSKAHSDYRVTNPKLEFWVAGWRVRNSDAFINDYKLLPALDLSNPSSATSLAIQDYFIGHQPVYRAGSMSEPSGQPFRIRIKFRLNQRLNVRLPLKFQLEFNSSSSPTSQYLLLAGDITSTPVTTSTYITKVQGGASFAARSGVDPSTKKVSMMSVKATSPSAEMLSTIDHKFTAKLKTMPDASGMVYELELSWADTSIDTRAFTLAAELDQISLKICTYLQQPLYVGTGKKRAHDIYPIRVNNPFYSVSSSSLSWYPRLSELKVNGKAVSSVGAYINPGAVANLTSLMHIGSPLKYYKASTTAGDLSLSYKLRLNCRGFFSPNVQRNFFSPDVFFPLNAVVVGSYKLNNKLKISGVGVKDKIISRLDDKIIYQFNAATNEVEVVIKRAKILQWLNLLVGNPVKNSARQFYLFLNITAPSLNMFTAKYSGGKPSLGAIVMCEV